MPQPPGLKYSFTDDGITRFGFASGDCDKIRALPCSRLTRMLKPFRQSHTVLGLHCLHAAALGQQLVRGLEVDRLPVDLAIANGQAEKHLSPSM